MKMFHSLYSTGSAPLKKEAVILFFSLLIFICSAAQPPVNISGIVNTYHKVIEIIPSKACVRITNVTALDINSIVMIVQMKGASIITTNTATFGDTTSLNEAGNYEIGTVCYIIGDSVFLFHNLLNTYNTSTGKVQLVQFAEYYSANVVDTVKAASWDSAAGTGGVIAIFANQDITLTKPISANSSGYSGGGFLLHSGNCLNGFPSTGYVYNGNNTTSVNSGAFKGEGVTNLTAAQSGGRGAPANGGGGGNNHNNSGGGGANLTAGGRGGGNSSTAGCTATLPGEAGKTLSSWNGQKIFLGGGGGAGHNNNGVFTLGGGNGGGIIFIWANNLIGNGQLITAGGGNGGQSQADGAGGGGGGGTIILHITNYTDNTIVQANGGGGGNSDDGGNVGQCYGGGGGGSGGVIYFTGVAPAITTSITAGLAGTETGRDGTCVAAQPALAGSNGSIFSSYTFSRSTNPAGYCQLLLPAKLLYFKATAVQKKVWLKWKIRNPELVSNFVAEVLNENNIWQPLNSIIAYDHTEEYQFTDNNPLPGTIQYRLKIVEENNTFFYSPVQKIFIDSNSGFDIYPNPATRQFTIAGNFSTPVMLQVSDLAGKIVFEKKISATSNYVQIDLPPVPAAVYVLRINNVFKKLVIR